MPDVVDIKTRSRMMSGIRSKNNRPEIEIRSALHRRGYRYRLHSPKLPGKPDIVFASRKAVIMVHGCFWHGHNCHLFKWPSSREDFWRQKILKNRERDSETQEALESTGWRTLIVWECALKGRTRKPIQDVVDQVSHWLDNSTSDAEIRGSS